MHRASLTKSTGQITLTVPKGTDVTKSKATFTRIQGDETGHCE